MISFATLLAFGRANWKLVAIAAALTFVFIWHKTQVSAAYEQGQAAAIQAARIEASKRIITMEKNNEGFKSLSARDRCIAFLRDSGLPVGTHCDP